MSAPVALWRPKLLEGSRDALICEWLERMQEPLLRVRRSMGCIPWGENAPLADAYETVLNGASYTVESFDVNEGDGWFSIELCIVFMLYMPAGSRIAAKAANFEPLSTVLEGERRRVELYATYTQPDRWAFFTNLWRTGHIFQHGSVFTHDEYYRPMSCVELRRDE